MTALPQSVNHDSSRFALQGRTLAWDLGEDYSSLSWALVGGGQQKLMQRVLWLQVNNDDLPPGLDPRAYIEGRLPATDASLVFLTSADLRGFQHARVERGGIEAQAIVTVGLGNALRAGDIMNAPAYIGTINLACVLDTALSEEAMLEALAIMTEAKTAALYDAGIGSRASGLPATGTGTDCQAILASHKGTPAIYAGKHTAIGGAIGAASYTALSRGIAYWKEAACKRR